MSLTTVSGEVIHVAVDVQSVRQQEEREGEGEGEGGRTPAEGEKEDGRETERKI